MPLSKRFSSSSRFGNQRSCILTSKAIGNWPESWASSSLVHSLYSPGNSLPIHDRKSLIMSFMNDRLIDMANS